jgi:hypothetical protein
LKKINLTVADSGGRRKIGIINIKTNYGRKNH